MGLNHLEFYKEFEVEKKAVNGDSYIGYSDETYHSILGGIGKYEEMNMNFLKYEKIKRLKAIPELE